MKSLLKDEKAILNPLLELLFSLFIIVSMYAIFVPMQFYIQNFLISAGAPAPQTLIYGKYLVWGFYLFLAGAIIVLIGRIYKKTYDTGKDDIYFRS